MRKKIWVPVILFTFFTGKCFAQSVAINNTGAAADTSAMLDVNSNTKGLLVPRMTGAQRGAIPSPATGLLVYQIDGSAGFYYYNGAAWLLLVTTAISTDHQNTLLYTVKGF